VCRIGDGQVCRIGDGQVCRIGDGQVCRIGEVVSAPSPVVGSTTGWVGAAAHRRIDEKVGSKPMARLRHRSVGPGAVSAVNLRCGGSAGVVVHSPQ
jgi:hypothetical protein